MIYRGYTLEELERAYRPSLMTGGDYLPYAAAYVAMSAQARAAEGVKQDIAYGPVATQIFDLFPAQTSSDDGPAPLHVYVHGGYWQALSQKEAAMVAPDVTQTGTAFVALNYTLAPDAHIRDMVDEVFMCLTWIADHAGELGIDPNRITLSGHSAGGHLVAMTLTKYGAELQARGVTITDAILISGVFDLEPIRHTTVNAPLNLTPEDCAELSPRKSPPVAGPKYHVVVAERDTDEFINQSRDYAEFLRVSDRDVRFEFVPGMHHFDVILKPNLFLPG
ncbi:MAG: alpha/beta hydrolase [Rhodobacteraceae bacterium]|nr:alpha/beta hydrolase [Paracoccaceae bacterium]